MTKTGDGSCFCVEYYKQDKHGDKLVQRVMCSVWVYETALLFLRVVKISNYML